MIAAAFALLLACTPTALLDFAMPKWQADKGVHIEDAYKWIYQATRGGEHAVPDRETAKQWLDSEWSSLGNPTAKEPLWEPLCKDGSIGRLNLPVYKQRGGKIDDILDAFLTSAREYKESEATFVNTWLQLSERLGKRSVNELTYSEWARLDSKMKAKSYPAIHHSKTYEDARHPAYRVLTVAQYQKVRQLLK